MTGLADTGKYTIQWAVTQSTSRPTTVWLQTDAHCPCRLQLLQINVQLWLQIGYWKLWIHTKEKTHSLFDILISV